VKSHPVTQAHAPNLHAQLRQATQAAAARERLMQDRIAALERELRTLRSDNELLRQKKRVALPEGCTREPRTGPAQEINLVAWRGAKGNRRRWRKPEPRPGPGAGPAGAGRGGSTSTAPAGSTE